MAAVKDSKLVGYCRVSTVPQTVQLQRDALTAAGCIRIFEDKVSSRVKDRTGLLAALDYLRIGDTLCVWKLDRVGRSVKEVLTIADDLHDKGIGLRILTGPARRYLHPNRGRQVLLHDDGCLRRA